MTVLRGSAAQPQAFRRPQHPEGLSWPWPDHDVDRVAYRLRALSAAEYQAREFLLDLEIRVGVRRLSAYVDRMSDDEITLALDKIEASTNTLAEAEARGVHRRGDLLQVRSRPSMALKWRHSTSQTVGGRADV